MQAASQLIHTVNLVASLALPFFAAILAVVALLVWNADRANRERRQLREDVDRIEEKQRANGGMVAGANGKITLLRGDLDDLAAERSNSCYTIGADFHVVAEQLAELGALVYAISNNLRATANRFQGRKGDGFPGDPDVDDDDEPTFTVNQASGQRCVVRENG